jgi:hypothetical protein
LLGLGGSEDNRCGGDERDEFRADLHCFRIRLGWAFLWK